MRNLVVLGCALLWASPADAQSAVDSARHVEFELREDGRVVSASAVRLQLGRQAAIAVRGPYSVRLRVDAEGDAGYTVRSHLTAGGPEGWTRLMTPVMTLASGQRGHARIERSAGAPLEIHVSVR